MDILDFSRSQSLNNIPNKKLKDILFDIDSSEESIKDKTFKKMALNRYFESNIPVDYWFLRMDKDFKGNDFLFQKYKSYVENLQKTYTSGYSLCFAGTHGVGKTMTACCILKKACVSGYSCLYTTLSDIVSVLTSQSDNKFIARKELMMVDFLVIDEFDSRFIATENAADLYARTLEGIFRTRSQNKLPTIMCTNSPNIIETFNGPLKSSIDSLMKGFINIVPILGEDFRKSENFQKR